MCSVLHQFQMLRIVYKQRDKILSLVANTSMTDDPEEIINAKVILLDLDQEIEYLWQQIKQRRQQDESR